MEERLSDTGCPLKSKEPLSSTFLRDFKRTERGKELWSGAVVVTYIG